MTGLAAIHLALTAMGASHFHFRNRFAHNTAEAYGSFSGSSAGYGYFSPGLDSVLRARFFLTDAQGRTFVDTLEADSNREAALRIGVLVTSIGERLGDERGRRDLTARWAGKMLYRHPDARQVSVLLEDFDLPSLVDYPARPRTGWRYVYRATYAPKERIAR
jgi:hypothetical protein